MTPSGTNLLGIVKHLGGVEYQWFGHTYGREIEPLEPIVDMDARPQEPTPTIVAFYLRARAVSNQSSHFE